MEPKELIGRNLKLAREMAGLSQEELADKLGIARATLSGFENGHVAIDSAKLLLAAKVLGRPAADFFKEHREELCLLYRAAEDVLPSAGVRSQFRVLCEGYKELEEIVGVADAILSPPEYPFLPVFQSRPLHFAEQVALSERGRLGLGQLDPIPNIFKLLDGNGVRVFALPIEEDGVFGLSAFSPHFGPCIVVNRTNTVERCIFTLAHEYGHLLMHRNLYVNRDPAKEHNTEIEEMANTFAAHFLVPAAALRDIHAKSLGSKDTRAEDVIFLKHYFRVSFKMMARRLRDTELISEKVHSVLLARAKTWEQDDKKEPAPLPIDLIKSWQSACRVMHLARKALMDGMISLGKLAELIGQNILETRGLVQTWRKEFALASA